MNKNDYVCVLGVYGKGNLGDEALLLSIVEAVTDISSDAQIVVFCSDPNEVETRYSIKAVSRSPFKNFALKLKLISQARAIILGGGTLLCDHNGFIANIRALASIFAWPAIGRGVGVPTLMYGQGLGPAQNWLIRWAIRHLLPPLMAAITVRDGQSGELLEEIAGTGVDWGISCDPVVASRRFQPAAVEQSVSAKGITSIQGLVPYCLVTLRSPKLASVRENVDYYRRCAEMLAHMCMAERMTLVLFPSHISEVYGDDREALEVVRVTLRALDVPEEHVAMKTWETMDEAVALIQGAEVVFSDRLHALLLAAMAGVPAVGVNIEDKIRGCLEMIGVVAPCIVLLEPDEVGSESARQALAGAVKADAQERQKVRDGIANWVSLNECNRRLLRKVLGVDLSQ